MTITDKLGLIVLDLDSDWWSHMLDVNSQINANEKVILHIY